MRVIGRIIIFYLVKIWNYGMMYTIIQYNYAYHM